MKHASKAYPRAAARVDLPATSPRPGLLGRLRDDRVLLAMLVITLLAGALRAKFILQTASAPLWYDEQLALQWSTGRSLLHRTLPMGQMVHDVPNYTSLEGARPLWEIWTCLKNDVQGPFYYIVLRLWREAFGSADLGVETLSAVASTVSVLVLMAGVRRVSGVPAALWAGLLMAVAPTQLIFCREVRPYAVAVLLVVLLFWTAARIKTLGGTWRRFAAFGVLQCLCMLTHYYSAGAVAGITLWALAVFPRRDRWRLLATTAAAAALFALAWGPILLEQLTYSRLSGNVNWMRDPPGEELANAMGRFVAIPARLLADMEPDPWLLTSIAGLVLFVAVTVRLCWRRDLLLAWLWLLGTVGLVAAWDVAGSMYQLAIARFWLVAAPAFYYLIAGLVPAQIHESWRKLWPHLVPGAVFVTLLGLGIMGTPHERFTVARRMPYDLFANIIENGVVPPAPLVIFCPQSAELAQNACLGLTRYMTHRPSAVMLLDHPPTQQELAELRRYETLWFYWSFHHNARVQMSGFVLVDRYIAPDSAQLSAYVRHDRIDPAHVPVVQPKVFFSAP